MKTYAGKSMAPGGGGAFAKFVDQLTGRGMGADAARATAAKAGRKKYGKRRFQDMAAAGRRRAARKRALTMMGKD